ncbi:hypothetical protein R3P38DRAFT_2791936 [Favolaschia claudopus]|uniref:Secreted protein n=1 Tax=Favolaschia claudopus TaxID=2862362 RepID=A0AAW0AFC2_9AGAR
MQPKFASLSLGLLSLLALVSHVAAVPGAAVDCHKIECPAVKCWCFVSADSVNSQKSQTAHVAPTPNPLSSRASAAGSASRIARMFPVPSALDPSRMGTVARLAAGRERRAKFGATVFSRTRVYDSS